MSPKTEWKDFFDSHAPRYEENCFTKHTGAEVDFLMQELGLSAGQRLLDVGCGTGRHAIELARRGVVVAGLDVSSGMLEEARRRAAAANVRVMWINADATEFSLRQRFDAVVCLYEGAFGLLGSTNDPIGQPLAILRNVAAVMRPQGKCLFTMLNGYALARKGTPQGAERSVFDPLTLSECSECVLPGAKGGTPLRERGFVPTELVLLFRLAGLDVMHIWGGTAGNWGRRAIDLDEIEIMVVARKAAEPLRGPEAAFLRP